MSLGLTGELAFAFLWQAMCLDELLPLLIQHGGDTGFAAAADGASVSTVA